MFKALVHQIALLQKSNSILAEKNSDLEREKESYFKVMHTRERIMGIIVTDFSKSLINFFSHVLEEIKALKGIQNLDISAETILLITYLSQIKEQGVNCYSMVCIKSMEQPVCISVWPAIKTAIEYFSHEIFDKQIKITFINDGTNSEVEVSNEVLFIRVLLGIIGIKIKLLSNNKHMSIETKVEKEDLVIEICDNGFGLCIDDAEQILQAPSDSELIMQPKLIKQIMYMLDIKMSQDIDLRGRNKLTLNIPLEVKKEATNDTKSNVVRLHIKNKY